MCGDISMAAEVCRNLQVKGSGCGCMAGLMVRVGEGRGLIVRGVSL